MHDDSKDKLIDYYSRAFATQDLKYTMMGMLLDSEYGREWDIDSTIYR